METGRDRMARWFQRISAYFGSLVTGLFTAPQTTGQRQAAAIYTIVIYASGVLLWGFFFDWGSIPLNFHDWADVTAPRMQFLKDALTRGEFPLHISNWSTFAYVTDRYMSVPDVFLSPQIVLLRWLDLGPFVFLNTLLLYSAGFLGLLKLRLRFHLSTVSFSLLFLLFNFNGHLLAHFGVGHATWGGYFLFPWVILGVMDLLAGDRSWGLAARLSVVLFIMFIQGSFHQFVWAIMLLVLIGACIPRLFWPAAKLAICAVLLSAVRILPPVLLLGKFDNQFIAGYASLKSIWDGLIEMAMPADLTNSMGLTRPVGLWEYSLYIGLGGALFLIIFGLYRWLSRQRSGVPRELALPLAIVVLLSLGDLYRWVTQLPLPLFAGERISSRMVSLVLVFLVVIATIEFQRWLDEKPRPGWQLGGISVGILILAHDLWQNLRLWRPTNAAAFYTPKTFAAEEWFVQNNYGDGGYLGLIALGAAVSLATIFALLFLARKEKTRRRC